jgi:hypothetical protein
MKDIGVIRSLYASLLSGITYNGQGVPVYTEEPFATVPDYYIQVSSVDQSPDNTDASWSSEVVVTLDVVTKQNMQNSRAAVDTISGSIMAVLLPNSFILQGNTDFQLFIISVSSPGYLHEQDGTIHINRKILRFFNRITEK